MGKSNKKQLSPPMPPPLSKARTSSSSVAPPPRGTTTPGGQRRRPQQQQFPPPFPADLPRPPNTGTTFLRNNDDDPYYKESFVTALDTCYEGLCYDENLLDVDETRRIQQSLHKMDDKEQQQSKMFRVDITQPFGLGTACARTYVTRMLMGDVGTTYKYLGLRMFSWPWSQEILDLKERLTERTECHLQSLRAKRLKQARISNHNNNDNVVMTVAKKDSTTTNETTTTTTGRSDFDICLINKMQYSNNLKVVADESDDNDDDTKKRIRRCRTAVSWHADSCLEHYSTIAVYQTIMVQKKDSNGDGFGGDGGRDETTTTKTSTTTSGNSNKNTTTNNTTNINNHDHSNDWTVALRVAHNAEGPHQGQQQQQTPASTSTATTTIATSSPPIIALSLPSNSAYYLLDDFNHHHQHTVLTNDNNRKHNNNSIRYSCTYRLLRRGGHNNVRYILDQRCRRTVANFHKKGGKVFRSEQLLLTEVESEWLRQFYIQGLDQITELMTSTWGESINQLWDYWCRLENRTYQIIQLLKLAAEGKCRCLSSSASSGSSSNAATTTTAKAPLTSSTLLLDKSERKLRDKQRKALKTIQELHVRAGGGGSNSNSGLTSNDSTGGSYQSLYECLASLLEERATLREQWEQRAHDPAFDDQRFVDYVPSPWPVLYDIPQQHGSNNNSSSSCSPMPQDLRPLVYDLRAWDRAYQSGRAQDLPLEHSRGMNWLGWASSSSLEFALEMQSPWAQVLMDGRKQIETRAYGIPLALLGRRIVILESPQGQVGKSGVGNYLNLNDATSGVQVVGWCTFASVKRYTEQAEFEGDRHLHLVSRKSGYGWKGTPIYGWVVAECGMLEEGAIYQSATRRMRSLFQLVRRAPTQAVAQPTSSSASWRTSHPKKSKRRTQNGSCAKKKKKRY